MDDDRDMRPQNAQNATMSAEFNEEWNEFTAETEASLARARAETRLQIIRGRLALQDSSEEVNEELNALEADLRQAYQTADQESSESWQEMQTDLAQLREEVEAESADALQTAERMIENLQADIRADDSATPMPMSR